MLAPALRADRSAARADSIRRRGRVCDGGRQRGEHRLQAKRLDAQRRTLAQSAPVTCHMWQASKLLPSRKYPQP
jgi:hypothetical protein